MASVNVAEGEAEEEPEMEDDAEILALLVQHVHFEPVIQELHQLLQEGEAIYLVAEPPARSQCHMKEPAACNVPMNNDVSRRSTADTETVQEEERKPYSQETDTLEVLQSETAWQLRLKLPLGKDVMKDTWRATRLGGALRKGKPGEPFARAECARPWSCL